MIEKYIKEHYPEDYKTLHNITEEDTIINFSYIW